MTRVFFSFIHNTISHPLMGVFPKRKWPNTFHDWTSVKMGFEGEFFDEEIDMTLWSTIHNVIAHPLMGFFPNRQFPIQFHNWTALKAGWQ